MLCQTKPMTGPSTPLSVIPLTLVGEVQQQCHDDEGCHLRFQKTLAEILQSCVLCQQKACKLPLWGVCNQSPQGPLEKCGGGGVNIAWPILPSSHKNLHLMVTIDYATHFIMTLPMNMVTVHHLISFMTGQVISRFHSPWKFITDWGPAMMSKKFQQFLQMQGIQHQPTMANHQQAKGLVKKIIQKLKTMTRQWLADNDHPLMDWEKVLVECTFHIIPPCRNQWGDPLFLYAWIQPQGEMGGSLEIL